MSRVERNFNLIVPESVSMASEVRPGEAALTAGQQLDNLVKANKAAKRRRRNTR